MKSKIIPATEKESSVTIRLTPVKIGELLAKVPEYDLPKVAEAFMQSRGMVSKHPEDVAALFFTACVERRNKPEGAKPTHELTYEMSDDRGDCIFQTKVDGVKCYISGAYQMARSVVGKNCGGDGAVYVLREIKR